ncbi:putative RNA polymerase II subunit B1 CTD phosphatase RPAP2 [Bombina bombina]|uniref:putative RNA polymerase II subunit B1 CTD phosphatase RPAP2 n=1 Tax=Bombina bombina TaxID=8345 RepID=UPI00235ADB7B|nr:putative RNA polymerase II subunit B1 CTD phosphatase RPAP2 [Bombina bombina]
MSERKSATKSRKASRKSSGKSQINDLNSEDAAKRKAALEAAIRRKIESEKKALQIVERLLDDDISEDFLVDCSRFISPAHYKDVVEERFIIRACGYPICKKKIENVPKQKYRISTKTNKVYDITERKCFCSNFCYRASKYYEAQIASSPIWMRDAVSYSEIQLMQPGESGHSGLEIKLYDKCIKTEEIEKSLGSKEDSENLDNSDNDNEPAQEFVTSIISIDRPDTEYQESDVAQKSSDEIQGLVEVTEKIDLCDRNRTVSCTQDQPLSSTSKDAEEKKDISKTSEHSELDVSGVTQRAVSKKGAEELRKILRNSKQYQSALKEKIPTVIVKGSMIDVLTQTLNEWKTEETLKYLYGSNYVLKLTAPADDLSLVEDLDEDDFESSLEASKAEGSTSLDESLMYKNFNDAVNPVPDLEKLQEETEILNIKAREFFKGNYILPEELENKKADNTDKKQENSTTWDPSLPLVDSCSQQQIRKRIVLEKLKKVLPAILLPLQLTYSDVSKELHSLVKTFRFTNKNITHTIPEWSIIAIVLLFALLPTMPLHKDSQQSPVYTEFISKLLEELQFQSEDLESLKQKLISKTLVV